MTDPPWLAEAQATAFGLAALPYGVFTRDGARPRVGVRLGDAVLDLAPVAESLAPDVVRMYDQPALNSLMGAGPGVWAQQREQVTEWLSASHHVDVVAPHLHPLDAVTMTLPFQVGDYVDFYSSRHHAENLGAMFRPGQPALTPNWLHLPIGYHGRSGTLVPSGKPIVRPCGQSATPDRPAPVFSPSARLDIEAEVGFVVGVPSPLGHRVPADDFARHVFGVVLVNDWSARDLQAWENVPLGPFLGKSFATSVSTWVTPLAALQHARVGPPRRVLPLLPYLQDREPWGLDITMRVALNGTVLSRPRFRDMYWTPAQQLAHMTVNGASLRTGDLFASGTVSGPAPDERGSLIELTWNGREPVKLGDGRTRTFLEDGDEVVITATAPGAPGSVVGLGEVRGVIRPALDR
jgi:fumarylacetoacetase